MANILYKVTAKKAFEAKGIKVPNRYASSTYFDIVKM